MSRFILSDSSYVMPTPAGAYFASSGQEQEPSRRLLRNLLQLEESPLLSLPALLAWTQLTEPDTALELLYHTQSLGWIEGRNQPCQAPTGALEDVLPGLLEALCREGKTLLADAQGFYLASHGFPHETAEEISALSADLASLHQRHRGVLQGNLGLVTNAWALVDAAGNSEIGFWPLHIGVHRFVLVVSGLPHMNQTALTQLIWALSRRYGRASHVDT